MYGIRLGSAQCPVFYEDGYGKTVNFSFSETKAIINSLLDRKARNNGVGKHLSDTLRITGTCRYDFSKRSEPLALYCKSLGNGTFEIVLLGPYPHELVRRLNTPGQQSRAITITRSSQAKRRHLRAVGLYKAPVKQKIARTLAGSSANLRLHFRNSEITCSDAIEVIAYATKFDWHWVKKRLVRSLDERAVASLRLKGGFVFRVDLTCAWRGLLDLSTLVEIRTTNDNTHGATATERKQRARTSIEKG